MTADDTLDDTEAPLTTLRTLRVLAKRSAVRWAQPDGGAFFRDELYGSANIKAQVVNVRCDLGRDQALETVLHEALHILSFDMHLDLTEEQVQALGAGVYSLLVDNPTLLGLLAARAT